MRPGMARSVLEWVRCCAAFASPTYLKAPPMHRRGALQEISHGSTGSWGASTECPSRLGTMNQTAPHTHTHTPLRVGVEVGKVGVKVRRFTERLWTSRLAWTQGIARMATAAT